jgi:hypothetical protein
MTTDRPGPDGYVETECQAAEARGTFAVPRFTPRVAAGEPVVRRVVLVRGPDGWEFGAGTVLGPQACEVAAESDGGSQVGNYSGVTLLGRNGTVQ